MCFFRNFRRRRIRSRPFPPDWDRFLLHNVPLYSRLPLPDRRELQGHVLVFLDEKRFEGCSGVKITDEVRLTVASQACLLLLHRPTDYFPRLVTVLVYPGTYVARSVKRAHGPLVVEADETRAGEAWAEGSVVLSWEDILASRDPDNLGYNVVIHEFAHELDEEYAVTDAVESFDPRRSAPWTRTLKKEYERLKADADRRRPTFLDDYGATDPAEFFAVATEAFFDLPSELASHHPHLYSLLKDFYHLDPAKDFTPPSP